MDVAVDDDADLFLQLDKDMTLAEIMRRVFVQREAVSRRLSAQKGRPRPMQIPSVTFLKR
jgi:hypothetical protein